MINDPAGLQPDSVYLIRRGTGFDLKVSDSGGRVLYPLNCCSDSGTTPGGTTDRPYKTYTATLRANRGQPPFIVDEFENELGISLSFEYQGGGRYVGYIEGETSERAIAFCNAVSFNKYPVNAAATITSGTIELYSGEEDCFIQLEVRFYNK